MDLLLRRNTSFFFFTYFIKLKDDVFFMIELNISRGDLYQASYSTSYTIIYTENSYFHSNDYGKRKRIMDKPSLYL